MEKSQSIAKLAAALLMFNKKVEAIKKDSTNPFFRSSYASLPNVIEHIRPILTECDLVLSQFPDENNGLVSILVHASSGEYMQSTYHIHPMPEYIKEKDKGGEVVFRSEYFFTPQAIGSAITYARRYAQCAILNLAVEDDDGNAGSGKIVDKKDQHTITKHSHPTKEDVEKVTEPIKDKPTVGLAKKKIEINKNFENEGRETTEPVSETVKEPIKEPAKKTVVVGKKTEAKPPVEEPKQEDGKEWSRNKPAPVMEKNPEGEFAIDAQDRDEVINKINSYTESKKLMDDAPGIIAEYKKLKPTPEAYEAVRTAANAHYTELVEKEKKAKTGIV